VNIFWQNSLVILELTSALVLSSCSTISSGIYGVKKLKPVDEKTILHYSEKYNIPASVSYELDTSYITFLATLDTTQYKEERKNHYQPLQALYYNKQGQLQSFQINCYAGGFPNLNWDRNEIFSTFPPQQQAPVDSILPLGTLLHYLQPLSQSKEFTAEDLDYVVIVFWNRFMGRQSKRLIRFVQDNSNLALDQNVKIIYVNNDNIFLEE